MKDLIRKNLGEKGKKILHLLANALVHVLL